MRKGESHHVPCAPCPRLHVPGVSHTNVYRERDMVTEAWNMVTAGWYIATKPMGHDALGHGEHGAWRL